MQRDQSNAFAEPAGVLCGVNDAFADFADVFCGANEAGRRANNAGREGNEAGRRANNAGTDFAHVFCGANEAERAVNACVNSKNALQSEKAILRREKTRCKMKKRDLLRNLTARMLLVATLRRHPLAQQEVPACLHNGQSTYTNEETRQTCVAVTLQRDLAALKDVVATRNEHIMCLRSEGTTRLLLVVQLQHHPSAREPLVPCLHNEQSAFINEEMRRISVVASQQ